MGRQRINPFDQGTAEHLLFRRMRDAETKTLAAKRHADAYWTDYRAESAKAAKYREAIEALGGKLPPADVRLLPPPTN